MTTNAILVLIGCATFALMTIGLAITIYFTIRKEIRQEGKEIRKDIRGEVKRLLAGLTLHEHDETGLPYFRTVVSGVEHPEELRSRLLRARSKDISESHTDSDIRQ